jgi:CRISPR-associated endonuclease/helicase Cas3
MFWAHSDPAGLGEHDLGSRWQPLAEHLANVSRLASELAKGAAPGDLALHQMASMAGVLHDFGKYTACFQQMIRKGSGRCPHSIYGAIAARQFGLPPGQASREWALPVVRAIAAHHAGLMDEDRLEPATRPKNEASDPKKQREIAKAIWRDALEDQPRIGRALVGSEPPNTSCSQDLLTRMLLSCLVDADRLDTAGRPNLQAPLSANVKLEQLKGFLSKLRDRAPGSGTSEAVDDVRTEVQELCRTAAQGAARLLSLAVPTGGGKTLAAMRFALERALARPGQFRRVIVVIPYLSIIEQNAEVYRTVFGGDAVFEHHSGAVYALDPKTVHGQDTGHFEARKEDETSSKLFRSRPETENWDSPVIVTTSVRFFETLFSNHPSDLRRAHNIARSIILLDEVQTLPRRLLAPLLAMLRELTADWGCTVVMATATQPAFEALKTSQERYAWPRGTVSPIIAPAVAKRMHDALQRVRIEWRLAGPTRWDHLASEMMTHPQALCVVNLRQHAASLHDALVGASRNEEQRESIFHLSTRMCAQHRLDVLAVIRARLANKLACLVVSTQLIEAGVDVDFPIAFRALGPLDAIIQVAGRVDREGRLTAAAGEPAGRLVVFESEDGKTPPHDYSEATAVTAGLARESDVQVTDIAAMQKYFERYYSQADGDTRGEHLARMRDDGSLAFATLAEEFEMINSRTKDVFVPYQAGKEFILRLGRAPYLNAQLLRQLQRYSVGLQPWEFEAAKRKTIYEVLPGSDFWACCEPAYEEKGRGLLTELPVQGLVL